MNTPSPTPSHVVVVGSFNVDHVWRCDVLPVAGATIAGRYANGPGGKGFNQAIAAVRAAKASLSRRFAAQEALDKGAGNRQIPHSPSPT